MATTTHMKSKMSQYMDRSEVIRQLQLMLEDDSFHTHPGYSIKTDVYPDHIIPFVDTHISYLIKHPQLNPAHYLSNLRLMLKVRS